MFKMNNCVLLRKVGGFYVCFDDSAIILFYFFDYKIKNGRVGFPISAISKVTNVLENNSINYVIKDNMTEVEKNIFGKKNKYKYYLDKGNNKISLDNRINNIMDIINSKEYEDIVKLLDLIEENI